MSEKCIGFGSSTITYTLDQLKAIKALKEEWSGFLWPSVRSIASGYIAGVNPKDIDELCAWIGIFDTVDERISMMESGDTAKMDYVTHL